MMVHEYYWQWSVVGRSLGSHITRPADGLGHFLQHIPSNRSQELKEFAAAMANGEGTSRLQGHRAFWCSDYAVQSSESPYSSTYSDDEGSDGGGGGGGGTPFVATLLMHSNRTTAAACVNGQGAMNEHLGDAMMYLYYNGTEFDGVFGSWKWNRLPGITAEQLPVEKCAYATRLKNDSARMHSTGTASNGAEGISAMSLVSHNLTAKKSVAMLQHAIVSLVAAIRCDSANAVFSTVDSGITPGEFTVAATDGTITTVPLGAVGRVFSGGVHWVHHGQTGYFFGNVSSVEVTKEIVKTTLASDDDSSGSGARARYELGIPHGSSRSPSQLQQSALWITVPGVSLAQMRAGVNTGVSIVANTGAAQAIINDRKLQGLAAVWHAGSTIRFPPPLDLTVAASESCTIIITDLGDSLNVTVNDPTNNPAGMTVELTLSVTGLTPALQGGSVGSVLSIKLPSGWNAGQSVTTEYHKARPLGLRRQKSDDSVDAVAATQRAASSPPWEVSGWDFINAISSDSHTAAETTTTTVHLAVRKTFFGSIVC
jgi:hypothetical protein